MCLDQQSVNPEKKEKQDHAVNEKAGGVLKKIAGVRLSSLEIWVITEKINYNTERGRWRRGGGRGRGEGGGQTKPLARSLCLIRGRLNYLKLNESRTFLPSISC